jgi:hypothetical protein
MKTAKLLIILGGAMGAILIAVLVYFLVAHKSGGSGGSSSSDIISMAKNGAGETDLLNTIDKNPPPRPSADEVIQLKQAGVSDKVIIALLHKSPAQPVAGK